MNSDLKPTLIFYRWSSVVRQTIDFPSGQREERDQGNILHTSVTPITFLQFYTCAVYHSCVRKQGLILDYHLTIINKKPWTTDGHQTTWSQTKTRTRRGMVWIGSLKTAQR